MFKTGKQKFTKEEIIDILKRNVSLYRDEEEFVQYIVDLAMYLVEHRKYSDQAEAQVKKPDETGGGVVRRRRDSLHKAPDQEVFNKLRKHSTKTDALPQNCRMCGAPTHGKITCPNCGNMTF